MKLCITPTDLPTSMIGVDLNLEKRPEFVEAYNWIHDRELFHKGSGSDK